MKKKIENYFEPREVKLSLSKSDFDILMYAFYNVDWSGYNEEEFDGEDKMAAMSHLCDIEDQLRIYFN